MDTFDELMHDILEAADEATHLNEMGPDYTGETRKAQERRTAAVERLHEQWDALVGAIASLPGPFEDCDCDDCNAIRFARAALATVQKA